MATVSNAERNAICDHICRVAGEDAHQSATLLDFVQTGLTGIAWESIYRTRAAGWAPYIASRLSITSFCDDVVRQAAVMAASRA